MSIAIVTGATAGPGRATALALAGQGITVVACHTDDEEAAHMLAQDLKALGDEHRVVPADAALEACVEPPTVVVTSATTHTMEAALLAPIRLSHALGPTLRHGAAIVHIGRLPRDAASAGLVGHTRWSARELGPRGVRVNHVAVGGAVTDEQVAAVAVFLAGERAAGVTGESVVVDAAS